MQRHFGGLKKPFNPIPRFNVGVEIIRKIQEHGYETNGKTFFEVGTGRVPLLPVAFWLCGAGKTITIDLNPYMRDELIEDMLFFIKSNESEIRNLFGDLLNEKRFCQLLDKAKTKGTTKNDIIDLCQIEYIAPGDASKTTLTDNSVNYHVSYTVYEHIPLDIIRDILKEGNRIIVQDGLFINGIDYGDHFSYMDKNISVINFLQFDDKKWARYAGNRYMYMNRARHDDFLELFKTVGHEFLEIAPNDNEIALNTLENGELTLDEKFKGKSNEILSITGSWFITEKPVLISKNSTRNKRNCSTIHPYMANQAPRSTAGTTAMPSSVR
jgi:hypothetical protein